MEADAANRAEIRRAIGLAWTYGRTADAIAALEALQRRHPNDLRLTAAYGTLVREFGAFAEAHALHAAVREKMPDDPALRMAFAMSAAVHAIDQRDPLLFDLAWRSHYPRALNIRVTIGEAPLPWPFVGIEIAGRTINLLISEALRDQRHAVPRTVARLMHHLPFWFLAVDVARHPLAVVVDLSDGDVIADGPPRLAFASNRPDVRPIPDPDFVSSGGYRRLLATLVDVPWPDRRQIALWRGATTGILDPGETIEALPRVRLVRLSRQVGMAGRLDAGFHAISDTERLDAPARAALEALMRPFVPGPRYGEWRYQVDVDGFSNAWSGFFARLVSGSPVLKVASRHGFRQWYYDRLSPDGNVAMVAADLSDFVDRLEWLRRHDDAARAIGAAGQALARSLTWRQEVLRGIDTAVAASRGRRSIAV